MSSSNLFALFKQAAFDVAGKPFDSLDGTTQLSDMGLDSVSAFEFVAYLEEKLNIQITDEELAEVTTLGDLDAVLRRSVAG